jgi:IstB-like ATP binding protein
MSVFVGEDNRGFADRVKCSAIRFVATALLDRLLHHAVVIQIEGSSYRLRRASINSDGSINEYFQRGGGPRTPAIDLGWIAIG